MNERIRELAEQTFYYGQWEGDGVYTGQLDLEKFAELIVQECAGLCSNPVVVLQHWGLFLVDR